MAIERKTTTKKGTAKSVKKRTTRKKAATEDQSTEVAEAAETTENKNKTAKPRSKAAAGAAARGTSTTRTESESALEVRTREDAVVIRFPPVGAPPFPARPPESDTPAESAAEEKPKAAELTTSDEPVEPAADRAAGAGRSASRSRRSRRRKLRESAENSKDAPQAAKEPSEPEVEVAETAEPSARDDASGREPDDKAAAPARRRRSRGRRGRSPRKTAAPDASSSPEPATDAPRDDAHAPADEVVSKRDGADDETAEPRETEEQPSRRRRGRRGGRRSRGKRGSRSAEDSPESSSRGDSDHAAPSSSAPDVPEATESVAADNDEVKRELAELPAVQKEMIINVNPREECRIAILENGKLEEIYLERSSSENHVGNIYKGRITNVEPSIQAAFIDFGLPKNGFLHISDVHPEHFPNGGTESERVGRKTPRRDRPPIQRCLRRGQEILVQIIKEGIGTKGPTLTTYLSIPGRFLVMLPSMKRSGVSRKIEDSDARDKLRTQMADLDLPEDMGFIARTAAMGHTKRELQADLNYLMRLWKAVDKRIQREKAPAELYRESDLVIRTIRDVFTSDIQRIMVDDEEVAERAREFLAILSPRARDAVTVYRSKVPIFHHYGVEAELERLHSRHVPLKSGGSLVFDSTEALVAIDVNSGSFREHDDAEETAYKINLEAAEEIARQLRLRDLGGVIVCDFIDMRFEKHRRAVERTLSRELKAHKERAKVLRMSDFGLIEMTRQRQRASLMRNMHQDCQHCRGTGLVKTAESVALDVMRLIQLAVTRAHISAIEVNLSFEVARLLQNRKRGVLHQMETENRRSITILPDPSYGLDQLKMQYYDQRGRQVPIN